VIVRDESWERKGVKDKYEGENKYDVRVREREYEGEKKTKCLLQKGREIYG